MKNSLLTKKTIKILNECADDYFFEEEGTSFWVYLKEGFENTYEQGLTSVHLESDKYEDGDYKYGDLLPLTPKEIEDFVMDEICDCR